MRGSALLGAAISSHFQIDLRTIGTQAPPLMGDWYAELEAARPQLCELAHRIDLLLAASQRPVTIMGRCAAAMATLPIVARRRPDALIVWFDAHADSNTPVNSATGYLGGLVLTGASGCWETGLGGNLALGNVILVGARDIDQAEQALIDSGLICHVTMGDDFGEQLRSATAGRASYVHIDCDVLEPGVVPTEYRVPGGMTATELHAAAAIIAEGEVIGVEIAEFEAEWAEAGKCGDPNVLVDALEPLLCACELALTKA